MWLMSQPRHLVGILSLKTQHMAAAFPCFPRLCPVPVPVPTRWQLSCGPAGQVCCGADQGTGAAPGGVQGGATDQAHQASLGPLGGRLGNECAVLQQ
jgi:hypothetical protein